jgi:hypothetical protein
MQTDEARLSGSIELTALDGEQEWLSVVLQLLSVLFLCTLLYDPSQPSLLGLARSMGVVALGSIVLGMVGDIIQRASISSVVRYLAKVILLGENGWMLLGSSTSSLLPAITHLRSLVSYQSSTRRVGSSAALRMICWRAVITSSNHST